jgi:hypothetical protein
MYYLDVTPMMDSLRTAPEDFTFKDGWLRHTASRHSFNFDPKGKIEIRAACECSLLLVKPEQERALFDCFKAWEADYWRPFQINREFASHFHSRLPWRRLVLRAMMMLTRWLTREDEAGAESLPSMGTAGLR